MSNPLLRDWRGRRAWVIGASSGIGRAVASALHAQGASVHVSARTQAALDEFTASHSGARAHVLDVMNAGSVARTAQEISSLGPLDLAFYCAGHFRATRTAQWQLDEMLRHQAVNYVGALYMLDAVLPAMVKAGRGHVSLAGSVAGYRGLPLSAAYGPTKAALIHLAEVMHLELRPLGLGVSIVNPGFVETPLTAQNSFHMPALMVPADAAREILAGWDRGHFEIHFPRRFTWPMKLLAMLPFRLYGAIVRRGTGSG